MSPPPVARLNPASPPFLPSVHIVSDPRSPSASMRRFAGNEGSDSGSDGEGGLTSPRRCARGTSRGFGVSVREGFGGGGSLPPQAAAAAAAAAAGVIHVMPRPDAAAHVMTSPGIETADAASPVAASAAQTAALALRVMSRIAGVPAGTAPSSTASAAAAGGAGAKRLPLGAKPGGSYGQETATRKPPLTAFTGPSSRYEPGLGRIAEEKDPSSPGVKAPAAPPPDPKLADLLAERGIPLHYPSSS